MAKRKPEPYAARPYAVEYYSQLIHRRPAKRGFCMTQENAYVKAGEHLDRGHFVKAVVVKRESGRVIVTRLKFAGRATWDQRGDYKPGDFTFSESLPKLED